MAIITQTQKRLYLHRINLACDIAVMKNAIFNREIVKAQGALESGWGTSQLAQKYNNVFGIKAGASWTGSKVALPTWEWVNGKRVDTVAWWRRYLSWNLCIVDYSNLLQGLPWFQNALNYLHDPDIFLREILPGPKSEKWPKGKPGWATDPKYIQQINRIRKEIQALEK